MCLPSELFLQHLLTLRYFPAFILLQNYFVLIWQKKLGNSWFSIFLPIGETEGGSRDELFQGYPELFIFTAHVQHVNIYLAAKHPLPMCSAEKCQDPSGPVSQEVKDCLRQQHTEAESWWLLKHTSWFTVTWQVGEFIPADQSRKYPECGVWVYVCAWVYFKYPHGKSLNQQLFQ